MRYNKLIERLQMLTGETPTQTELAKILGIKPNAMSGRAARNSNFTDEELVKIEDVNGLAGLLTGELFVKEDLIALQNKIKKCTGNKEIEAPFNFDLDSIYITSNSLERQNDKTIKDRYESFGIRLTKIQDEHEYLDKDMAKLLHISEIDYIYMKCGDLDPDIEVLNRLKQCFEVSIDWLLYGD